MIEKIYNILKKRIINLEFKFDQKINVKKLAENFNVSQTPIRDALNNLVKDELVIVKPRIGYFITKFNKNDLCEIYEVRKMIECFALESSIYSDHSKFKKYHNEILNIRENFTSPKYYDKFNDLDSEIHLSIVEESKNKQLIKVFKIIYPFVQISQNFDKTGKKSLNEIYNVILLLEKILDKDILNAKLVLREHIENCKIIGVESLKNYNIG